MFKKIALGLVAVIVAAALVIVALAASKPDTFVCERAREMDAPREAVLPLVADFRNWPSWSPWREYDPNQTITYGATTSGVGGTYAWRGNDQVGRGEMEIESVTERGEQTTFTHRLEFFEPFASRASTRFVVEPAGAGRTKVTWTMTSTPAFMEKILDVLMDMDATLGADFDRGLRSMEREARRRPTPTPDR
jgi:hypothetical protein